MTVHSHTLIQTEESHVLLQTEDMHTLEHIEVTHDLEVTELVMPGAGYVASDSISRITSLSQAAYDLLAPPNPSTLYVII